MDLLEGAYTLTKGLQVTPIDHELVCVVTEDAEVELPVFIWDCLNRDFVDTYQYVDRYVKLKSRTSVQVEKWREVFEMCITSRLLLEVPNAEITFANARDPLALMRRQSSDNLVFVYQGDWVDTLGGVPPLEFLEQTGLLQNNIVMLRDATSQFYTNGVSVDLPSLEHLVGWQIAAKQMFNAKATYHAGSSAGAFGALLLGHRTRATKVWCFSLPMLEFNGIDLRELLARPNGATQYYLWYGAGNPRDTATALELARFEGVTTIPVDFDGHLLAHHLWGAKSLPRLLESGASAASAAPTQDDASRRRVAADEVRRIVQECTEQPIRLDSKLNETLDSLEIVACMAGIQDHFGIDVAPAAFSGTVQQLFEHIVRHDGAAHAVVPAHQHWLANGEEPLVAVLSSSSASAMTSQLTSESVGAGIPLRFWFGPFGQLEQPILSEGSELWRCSPKAIWLHFSPFDVDPGLAWSSEIALAQSIRLSDFRHRLLDAVTAIRERSTVPVFVSNIGTWRCADRLHQHGASLQNAVQEQNRALATDLAKHDGVFVFDLASAIAASGLATADSPLLWYTSRVPYSDAAGHYVAEAFVRLYSGVSTPRAKCVVVDLDNTLWGGVLGDDGIAGVTVGGDYPGNAYQDFQRALLNLKARGLLLTVVSKNDEAVVREMFAREEMVLHWEDFVAVKANWNPKASNIAALASELNLGLDSFVFIDDSAVERAHVRACLPDVIVPEWPTEPHQYVTALGSIWEFDRFRILDEDRNRTKHYLAEASRSGARKAAQSLEEFLKDLNMVARVGKVADDTMERVVQLIGKTNQFNLTTRRHTQSDLVALRAKGAEILWLRLSDRFGDSGLVCAGILLFANAVATVDTFVMSCRVMGRDVENAFLALMAERARAAGCRSLVGEYRPTKKNAPVREFYRRNGFQLLAEAPDSSTFRIELTETSLPWPPSIRRPAGVGG